MLNQVQDTNLSRRKVVMISIAVSLMLSNLFFLTTMQILPVSIESRFLLPLVFFILGGLYVETIPQAIYAAFLSVLLFATQYFIILSIPYLFGLLPNNEGIFLLLNISFITQLSVIIIIESFFGYLVGAVIYEFL